MCKVKKDTDRHKYKCSVCGQIFYGYGNSSWPVTRGASDKCCDTCNSTKVIPMRVAVVMLRR